MIAVIFEVIPQQGQMQSYQKLAAELAQTLATQAGFISVERFQSLSDPEKLLSLSFWQDE
ncbi:antibiotic biosynthesis monooxygenase [Rheinheimera sp. A13L]|nr:antibiotic biosynthesis monooxygenase [Rheinheimera sp. A13L]